METAGLLHRHYSLPNLNFRDFWDICSHYQRVNNRYRRILYSVDGFGQQICENEGDVSRVLAAIARHDGDVRQYTARYYQTMNSEPGDYGNAKMAYLPERADFMDAGLHFFSESTDKLLIFQFEDFIYNGYTVDEEVAPEVEYGLPCEVLALVIDMRGFTAFGEQATIESPYVCGIMSAFYHMVRQGFKRYQPDMVKFLGDGVLSVWQTNSKDRQIAVETALEGLRMMPFSWRHITKGPEFSHGAPEGIGAGVSFGLASKLLIDQDYLGRPINLASRLCGICPPGRIYVDKSVPGTGGFGVKQATVHLKSFGEQKVWVIGE